MALVIHSVALSPRPVRLAPQMGLGGAQASGYHLGAKQSADRSPHLRGSIGAGAMALAHRVKIYNRLGLAKLAVHWRVEQHGLRLDSLCGQSPASRADHSSALHPYHITRGFIWQAHIVTSTEKLSSVSSQNRIEMFGFRGNDGINPLILSAAPVGQPDRRIKPRRDRPCAVRQRDGVVIRDIQRVVLRPA